MLLRGDARRTRDDYLLEISLSLPFQTDTNTGLGIVIKCFLEGLITYHGSKVTPEEADSESVKEAKETIAEMLESTFESVKNIKHELGKGFRFWRALMISVRLLGEEKSMSPETVEQFEAADRWLAPMNFE
ncbi:hypothetical protein K437DRAFT_223820 [Tilletiaria anomala UBC 951]|uniref:Post-transcriptional regulator MKT1 C-terminal domain-containing protein n=1 Tax=Tilletiaria anomala (strain ATCC 24038 / CBS 436.72 / UBC 951) TaxID=1037660 RepID=A0A066VXA9_TILAU|nr:uncharacterized protein K437DRAFT_223820 [Tilletiaria anomala UBC 951]KDN46136.1 hypothetical protein K437DRAFT_223820 [Tilletiaria anomala UBC 951]